MLFLGTQILHCRERISLMKMGYFICIHVPDIDNPMLNIKAVMCMKRYTNF